MRFTQKTLSCTGYASFNALAYEESMFLAYEGSTQALYVYVYLLIFKMPEILVLHRWWHWKKSKPVQDTFQKKAPTKTLGCFMQNWIHTMYLSVHYVLDRDKNISIYIYSYIYIHLSVLNICNPLNLYCWTP